MIEEIDRKMLECNLKVPEEIMDFVAVEDEDTVDDLEEAFQEMLEEANDVEIAPVIANPQIEMRHQHVNQFLNQLQMQFLCGHPIEAMQWESPFFQSATYEEQQMIVTATYKNVFNQEFPIDFRYQCSFLKRLMTELNKANTCIPLISECYLEAMTKAAKQRRKEYAYKHYIVPGDPFTTILREWRDAVSGGKTGFRTSPAAVALADYLVQHKDSVSDRNVLELGGGTGMCSLLVKTKCFARTVLLTDGNKKCVRWMRRNFKRNFQFFMDNDDNGIYPMPLGNMIIQQLKWRAVHENTLLAQVKPQVILAAEVLYEKAFDDFLRAVDFVFNLNHNHINMLLATSVKNEEKLNTNLQKLADLNFTIKDEPVAALNESLFHWDRSTGIRILLVTREHSAALAASN